MLQKIVFHEFPNTIDVNFEPYEEGDKFFPSSGLWGIGWCCFIKTGLMRY